MPRHADEERLSQPRRRALLRLLGELVFVGVLPVSTPLQRLLTDLAAALPWTNDREAAANNLALLAHFVKVSKTLVERDCQCVRHSAWQCHLHTKTCAHHNAPEPWPYLPAV